MPNVSFVHDVRQIVKFFVYIYSFYVSKSNRFLHLIEYEDGHLLKHAEKTNLA